MKKNISLERIISNSSRKFVTNSGQEAYDNFFDYISEMDKVDDRDLLNKKLKLRIQAEFLRIVIPILKEREFTDMAKHDKTWETDDDVYTTVDD